MRVAARTWLAPVEVAAIWAMATLVVVLATAVFLIGFDALVANLAKLDVATLVLCLLLMGWQVGGRFLRWMWYARCLGLPLSVREGALFYGAGLGMTLTPGRLGELIRLWLLERRFAAPYRRLVSLYVMDRISDAVTYVILFAVGAVSYSQGTPMALSGVVVVLVGVAALMRPAMPLRLLTGVYALIGHARNLVLWLRRAIRNTSALSQPRVFLPGLLMGTLGWLAAPVILTLVLAQMGVHLPLLNATAIYAAGALAGGATMLPGGGGGTEAVILTLLRASEVPIDAAVAAVIVTRVTFLWAPVGIGIIALPLAMKAVRQ